MKFSIWGARGSIPVSGKPYVVYGGDTTCLEVETEGGETIILDAGTGIRALGNRLMDAAGGPRVLHFFLTHAHWDHLLGFPFFRPIYSPEFEIHVHGCTAAQESVRTVLRQAMHPPFFPVNLDDVRADLRFDAACSEEFEVGDVRIRAFPLNHPNGGSGFRLEEGAKSAAFFPDNELTHPHPGGRAFEEYASFLSGVDWLLHDAEYRPEEYERFSRGWGHSVFLDAVRLAVEAGAGGLWLWHLNQDRTDEQVDVMVEEAQREVHRAGADFPVRAAATGQMFSC